MDQHHIDLRNIVDGLSIASIVATLVGWLPSIAALASLIWTLIRIYETATVQGLIAKAREKWR